MNMSIAELLEDKNRKNVLTGKVNIIDEFIYYDFLKTHITDKIGAEYIKKLEDRKIYESIENMFSGKKINYTENKEVLHTLLRNKNILKAVRECNDKCLENNQKSIFEELNKIKDFTDKLHSKKLLGCTGKPVNTIINIGIGGSDLGPKMVCESLARYKKQGINVHFISNIDATATLKVLEVIDPETSLFIICSKTFTTLETIKNMDLAFKLLEQKYKSIQAFSKAEIYDKHFVAVSSNVDKVREYNISNNFAMWDFVGGRYSLWSAIGLSIACYIGFDNFIELLEGASIVDEGFKSRRGTDNVEILHAITELYYSDIGYNNKCTVSYDQYLEKLYLYLQQAEMESNGKFSKTLETGMIIWGGVGTDTQHSFFQLLHQGTRKILTEFIFPFKPCHTEIEHHEILISNCFAQSRALMTGKQGVEGKDFFPGDRPSITIGYSCLCPRVLGGLIAHYEHKIFVQGIFFGINSFDQFGVTLGKSIALDLFEHIHKNYDGRYDTSTNELLKIYNEKK